MRLRIKSFVGVLFVILATVFLHHSGFLRGMEDHFRSVLNPIVARAMSLTRTIRKRESFENNADLRVAYASAKEQLRIAQSDATRLRMLEEENKHLRTIAGFLQKTAYHTVGADVVGLTVDPIGNAIVLNRGSRDGIDVGNPAIADGGVIVGKVIRSDADTSLVALLSHAESKVAAMTVNGSRSMGIVEGGYGTSVRMTFVPEDQPLAPGDIIVTSGLEPGIPSGLEIGRVTAVEKEAYQPFQNAMLSTAADLRNLGLVSVIISTSSSRANTL